MHYLITGTAGFIGFHLAKTLLDQGNVVIGIDNLNDYYSVELKQARHNILKQYAHFKEYIIDLVTRQITTLCKNYESRSNMPFSCTSRSLVLL